MNGSVAATVATRGARRLGLLCAIWVAVWGADRRGRFALIGLYALRLATTAQPSLLTTLFPGRLPQQDVRGRLQVDHRLGVLGAHVFGFAAVNSSGKLLLDGVGFSLHSRVRL